MSGEFDSRVYARRQHTPWARMSLTAFMSEVMYRSNKENITQHAALYLSYRPDVASNKWWTIEWYGEDQETHDASAQDLDLCLFRAAEIDLNISKEIREREKISANPPPPSG